MHHGDGQTGRRQQSWLVCSKQLAGGNMSVGVLRNQLAVYLLCQADAHVKLLHVRQFEAI